MKASLRKHDVGDISKSLRPPTEIRMICAACLVATVALIATAVAPSLDLDIARAVLLPANSPFRPAALVLREILRFTPWAVCIGVTIWLLVQAQRGLTSRALAFRRAAFVVGLFAVGPGLLVNAGLKNHAHRPRPVQTAEIGPGTLPFRPYYKFDGGCGRNCSFSSGEASTAFWTTAPALLAPPPIRVVTVGAALLFGAFVSAMRMNIGAHFLSDVTFSALAILLLTLAARRLLQVG